MLWLEKCRSHSQCWFTWSEMTSKVCCMIIHARYSFKNLKKIMINDKSQSIEVHCDLIIIFYFSFLNIEWHELFMSVSIMLICRPVQLFFILISTKPYSHVTTPSILHVFNFVHGGIAFILKIFHLVQPCWKLIILVCVFSRSKIQLHFFLFVHHRGDMVSKKLCI